MRIGKVYCPVKGWDCPYYHNGECGLDDPYEDCDGFMVVWDKDDDYVCEDEPRTAFDE